MSGNHAYWFWFLFHWYRLRQRMLRKPPPPGMPLHNPSLRAVVKRSWAPTVTKAREFTRTVTSGTVTEEVFERRLAVCQSCPANVRRAGDKWYCSACGCPEWAMSELHTKLWFEGLACPEKRF